MSADAKAGKYELIAHVWEEPTSAPDAKNYTYTRHVQGDIVTLDEDTAKRLLSAGAVVKPGEREKAEAEALQAQLAQAQAAYDAALAKARPEPQESVAPKSART